MWMPPIDFDAVLTPPVDTRRPRLIAMACRECGRDTLLRHYFDSAVPTTWTWWCAYDDCRRENATTRVGELIVGT